MHLPHETSEGFLAEPSDTALTVRPELQPALHAARTLPNEDLAGFLGDLEVVRSSAWARLICPPPAGPVPDQLLDVTSAARLLGMSPDYLYHHHRDFGFSRRLGRSLRFSSRGIENFIQRRSVHGAKRPSGKTEPLR